MKLHARPSLSLVHSLLGLMINFSTMQGGKNFVGKKACRISHILHDIYFIFNSKYYTMSVTNVGQLQSLPKYGRPKNTL